MDAAGSSNHPEAVAGRTTGPIYSLGASCRPEPSGALKMARKTSSGTARLRACCTAVDHFSAADGGAAASLLAQGSGVSSDRSR